MYEKNVAVGSAWLDTIKPGWHRTIDLAGLNVQTWGGCVMGQSFSGIEAYLQIKADVRLAEKRGFVLIWRGTSLFRHWREGRAYAQLTSAWKQEIIRRKQAEALMSAAIESVKLEDRASR